MAQYVMLKMECVYQVVTLDGKDRVAMKVDIK